jgi:hypothetical protein
MAAKPTLPPLALVWSPPTYVAPHTLSDTQVGALHALWLDPPRSPDAAPGKLGQLFPNIRTGELSGVAALWMAVFGNPWAAACFHMLCAYQPAEPMTALTMLMQRAPESPPFAKQAAITMYTNLFHHQPDRRTPWHAVQRFDL